MENVNQDAMLNERSQTFRPDTDGPAQTPDESIMINEDYNPTDLAGDVDSGPDGIGNPSGSAAMEPNLTDYGNGDTLGNNDGTEPDPELSDE
ncbi:hypothetical protein [Spirosoma validum]|uniref:Uncharacterized protein n=1 Tax=Spirosoma validum TaxID=2771355 RepID=A0A927B1A4_9BACT|nr:hypothetical protein [Spirosoma validum]MBD2753709.1 hypothetical protein [Spirosoma validum]